MDELVKKELLEILSKTIDILEKKEEKETEELKELSDEAAEEVALHKDLDLISLTVLVYSLYKTIKYVSSEDYKKILACLRQAKESLGQNNLGKYNQNIKSLFETVKKCDMKIKEHLADVMHAARIKKGASLLQKGLSLGQAAGLMGLSNWDLQQYIGKTLAFEQHRETTPPKKRMLFALKLFGA